MIRIDLGSPVPFEEQIARELRQAIAGGLARPGDELPSIRQLAADLGVHWNTVARAYKRLHDDGLVSGGHGRRTTVRVAGRRVEHPAKLRARIRGRLREALADARLGGLPLSDVEDLLRTELRTWRTGEDR